MIIYVKLSPQRYIVGHTEMHKSWRSTGRVNEGYESHDLTVIHGPAPYAECHTAASQWAIKNTKVITYEEYQARQT